MKKTFTLISFAAMSLGAFAISPKHHQEDGNDIRMWHTTHLKTMLPMT